MFSLAKLLVPIDFSERCLGAARYAIPVVEHFHSELTLLHVVHPIDEEPAEAAMVNESRARKAQKQLDSFLCAALNHLNTRRVLRQGDPAATIVEQARHDGSDLIMMPTHGYGPFRRLLLGSVTAKVLHDAPCGVWTGAHLAQGPPMEWLRLRHIACALDVDDQSGNILRYARWLAGEFHSHLTIVHVVQFPGFPSEEPYADQSRQRWRLAAAEALERLQAGADTHAQLALEWGEVASQVAAVVRKLGADLLIIGRGRSSDARLGTHVYNVIRQSPCPVLSI